MSGQIVVGVDGSAPATAALEWAADDAARKGATLKIVCVREPWAGDFPFHAAPGLSDVLREHCDEVLAAAAARARRRAPGIDVITDQVIGAVVERLKSESETADTLVLGSRGSGGFAGLVLGSVGMGVVGHAAGPVVIVRQAAQSVHGEIAVGYDGSAHAAAALEYAFEQARLRDARLHVVHAWHTPAFASRATAYTDLLQETFESESHVTRQRLVLWRDKHPDVSVRESILWGHPVPALTDASRSADLVVVGSRGLGNLGSALLGSVSHGLLHRAHCPVAVVRPRQEIR
ncbi:universal stress protein [Streptosporangium roseum]|uniref:universal stress protein n=1 Tax=Streptosporangium roseum TaxID=2001 RepID=UPI0004CCD4F1|nr:universal stress protein [Streptosporangium roseum]